MKNLIKYMYILAEIFIIGGFAYFLYLNQGKTIEYICPVMQKVYTSQLNHFAIMIFAFAYLAGYACSAFIKSKVTELCSAYQKRHENISITNESDKARIETLEAKIKTLETALKSALDN